MKFAAMGYLKDTLQQHIDFLYVSMDGFEV